MTPPHHCTAGADEAHAQVLLANARYREALRDAHRDQHYEPPAPREGIVDLIEWGRWCHALDCDRRAAKRAEQRLARLSPLYRRALVSLYVDRDESLRDRRLNRHRKDRAPLLHPAEEAYLALGAQHHRITTYLGTHPPNES